ncbi:MAG: hypothetical protein GY910_08750, partial [bacterium]|nr:hypothetical protein [bacterium]
MTDSQEAILRLASQELRRDREVAIGLIEKAWPLLERFVTVHSEVMHEHASQMRIAVAAMCSGFEPAPDTPSLRRYGQQIVELRQHYFCAIARGIADGSMRPDLDPAQVGGALWAGMFGASIIRMNAPRFRATVPQDPPTVDLDRIR